MTDRDVVERASQMMNGVSVIRKPGRAKNWQDQWSCHVDGEDALTVMRSVLPFMGERRSFRIQELISHENLAHLRKDGQ
jgi:hypothetical protein